MNPASGQKPPRQPKPKFGKEGWLNLNSVGVAKDFTSKDPSADPNKHSEEEVIEDLHTFRESKTKESVKKGIEAYLTNKINTYKLREEDSVPYLYQLQLETLAALHFLLVVGSAPVLKMLQAAEFKYLCVVDPKIRKILGGGPLPPKLFNAIKFLAKDVPWTNDPDHPIEHVINKTFIPFQEPVLFQNFETFQNTMNQFMERPEFKPYCDELYGKFKQRLRDAIGLIEGGQELIKNIITDFQKIIETTSMIFTLHLKGGNAIRMLLEAQNEQFLRNDPLFAKYKYQNSNGKSILYNVDSIIPYGSDWDTNLLISPYLSPKMSSTIQGALEAIIPIAMSCIRAPDGGDLIDFNKAFGEIDKLESEINKLSQNKYDAGGRFMAQTKGALVAEKYILSQSKKPLPDGTNFLKGGRSRVVKTRVLLPDTTVEDDVEYVKAPDIKILLGIPMINGRFLDTAQKTKHIISQPKIKRGVKPISAVTIKTIKTPDESGDTDEQGGVKYNSRTENTLNTQELISNLFLKGANDVTDKLEYSINRAIPAFVLHRILFKFRFNETSIITKLMKESKLLPSGSSNPLESTKGLKAELIDVSIPTNIYVTPENSKTSINELLHLWGESYYFKQMPVTFKYAPLHALLNPRFLSGGFNIGQISVPCLNEKNIKDDLILTLEQTVLRGDFRKVSKRLKRLHKVATAMCTMSSSSASSDKKLIAICKNPKLVTCEIVDVENNRMIILDVLDKCVELYRKTDKRYLVASLLDSIPNIVGNYKSLAENFNSMTTTEKIQNNPNLYTVLCHLRLFAENIGSLLESPYTLTFMLMNYYSFVAFMTITCFVKDVPPEIDPNTYIEQIESNTRMETVFYYAVLNNFTRRAFKEPSADLAAVLPAAAAGAGASYMMSSVGVSTKTLAFKPILYYEKGTKLRSGEPIKNSKVNVPVGIISPETFNYRLTQDLPIVKYFERLVGERVTPLNGSFPAMAVFQYELREYTDTTLAFQTFRALATVVTGADRRPEAIRKLSMLACEEFIQSIEDGDDPFVTTSILVRLLLLFHEIGIPATGLVGAEIIPRRVIDYLTNMPENLVPEMMKYAFDVSKISAETPPPQPAQQKYPEMGIGPGVVKPQVSTGVLTQDQVNAIVSSYIKALPPVSAGTVPEGSLNSPVFYITPTTIQVSEIHFEEATADDFRHFIALNDIALLVNGNITADKLHADQPPAERIAIFDWILTELDNFGKELAAGLTEDLTGAVQQAVSSNLLTFTKMNYAYIQVVAVRRALASGPPTGPNSLVIFENLPPIIQDGTQYWVIDPSVSPPHLYLVEVTNVGNQVYRATYQNGYALNFTPATFTDYQGVLIDTDGTRYLIKQVPAGGKRRKTYRMRRASKKRIL